ncbi:enoyl-CoA hydratase/isomerase family protein [Achromobacter spanius]|uniref:Enoyl-CoA hydratase n=1 Tax=Achromobacter spanius TaxID=217203 RepID=A0A2S0IB03_9BURK|nr:enoyl-CoA hydratase-related protein [Achromobacter spanius]AVJ29231.1 enoyl-CoA hydratase [Achromobacter spanius]
MTTADLEVQLMEDGPLATVRLNRPERLNALTEPVKQRLGDVFLDLAFRDEVRAVILTGAGRGFCASGDVNNLGSFTAFSTRERFRRLHRAIAAIANLDKPVVAAVRGPVAGVGFSMALASDMIVASETARFSMVFKNVGLAPDGGAVYFLAQALGMMKAKELVFSGCTLDAAEAKALGLVCRVVPDAELDAAATDLALSLAQGPTMAFGLAKRMFKAMTVPTLEAFLDLEATSQGLAVLGQDHQEGVQAFLAKRPPAFSGR